MTTKLTIEKPHIEALISAFPDLTPLTAQLRLGDRIEVDVRALSEPALAYLEGLYRKGGPRLHASLAQVATLRHALDDDGLRFSSQDLETALPAIARYLVADGLRGWMFTASVADHPLPYVVTRLDYTPPSNDEAGRIYIELKANAKGAITTTVLRISATELVGRTVAELFASKGFLKETTELVAAYDETTERYFAWRGAYGSQFAGRGRGFFTEDPNSSHRDTDWSRKDVIVLSADGGAARLVNDESILTNRSLTLDVTGDILGQYLRKAGKSNLYNCEDEVEEAQAAVPKDMFRTIPVHPYVLMFHLDRHHYLWVHVNDMEPYAYQPDLKQKLILPTEQTELIDILTAEMDVLAEDIIAGKSGGTTVLCAGPPGVGKTLTAEVYSEIIKRPLYRVHSGQLGLSVASMEVALKEALTRAQRWGAVMLIDEADVYIKRRCDDITMNAVVGVFLRVLEYFNGLLFLTTNRIDDIDEAIVSRCIALVKFYPPDAGARRRIWVVMTSQFGISVGADIIEALVDAFPEASGRDIKGLTKLAAKFCRHKALPPTLDIFRQCAVFRGIDYRGTPA